MASVKICGITSESDLEMAVEAGADMVGFVIVETSPRFVDFEHAQALIRRAAGHASPVLRCGPVEVDTNSANVTVNGESIKLTGHEYKLLSYMIHHMNKIVSRTELTEHIYDQDFDRDSNTIEVFVGRLRKKLGVDVIKTVRGLGYRMEPDGEAS